MPWHAAGTLNCRVELENGEEASSAATVEPFDFSVVPQDISWEYSGDQITPGRRVGITAKIQKYSRISFSHTVDTMRKSFLS